MNELGPEEFNELGNVHLRCLSKKKTVIKKIYVAELDIRTAHKMTRAFYRTDLARSSLGLYENLRQIACRTDFVLGWQEIIIYLEDGNEHGPSKVFPSVDVEVPIVICPYK